MKKLGIVVGVLLACGAAYGTAYEYTGGADGAWGTSTNWTPVGVPGEGDCASLGNGNNVVLSGTITVSELIVDNGTGMGNDGWGGSYSLIVTDNGGNTSGDFHYKSDADCTINHSGMMFNWDIAGHCIFERSGALRWNYPGGTNKIILRGANKAYRHAGTGYSDDFTTCEIYGSYFDNGSRSGTYDSSRTVQVMSGGQIVPRPDAVASAWMARGYVFEDGQANLPAIGSDVDFDYQCKSTDNGAGKNLVVTGGVIYPRDVSVGQRYWGSSTRVNPYVWRVTGGDMTVARDLLVGSTAGRAHAVDGIWLSTKDNVTAASRNLTVNRDLTVRETSYPLERYGLKLNASTVRIGRDLDTNEDGTVDFGSSTVRLGGDLTVTNPTAWSLSNWSAGTSTLICDGNGLSGIVQTLTLTGNPLHTLNVDTDCTVALGGDLLLTGDLIIEDGEFRDNDRKIMFNGTHQLEIGADGSVATGSFDNIILLADAVVNLGSDILTDNLAMGDSSAMYLNSLYILQADGFTYDGLNNTGPGGAGPWSNDGGTIYPGVIPEPGTMLLIGTGILGLLGYIRRRRMK